MRSASGEKEEEESQPERPGGASVGSGSLGHAPGDCQAVSHNIVLCGILVGVCPGWQADRLAWSKVFLPLAIPS